MVSPVRYCFTAATLSACFLLTGTVFVACGSGGNTASTPPADISLVSENGAGVSGSATSRYPAINRDGRYIVFESVATNLVANDTNGASDIFLRDMDSGIVTRVSVAAAGTEANGPGYRTDISGDGKYIVFHSDADNLVPGDTNTARDVFVRDAVAGSIARVSVPPGGGETDGDSQNPAISTDGRYVAFESWATNLVTGDTNSIRDIFVRDLTTNAVSRASVAYTSIAEADGISYSPDISSDGRYVTFFSAATNLVTGDTNGFDDVFVFDTQTGITSRASVSTMGTEGNDGSYDPRLSADGRYVVFESDATNLDGTDTNNDTDVFIHDLVGGETRRVSRTWQGLEPDGFNGSPDISADGRHVVFRSDATNLVANDTNNAEDIFVYDTTSDTVALVSMAADGTQGDMQSRYPKISGDNRYVTLQSLSTNLVAGTLDYSVWHVYRAPRP